MEKTTCIRRGSKVQFTHWLFPDHVLTGVVDEFNTHTAVVKLDERSAAKGFGKTMYPSLSRLTVIEG